MDDLEDAVMWGVAFLVGAWLLVASVAWDFPI